MYRVMASPGFDSHVFAMDPRGFGDSTGTPSEAGIALDVEVRARYPWQPLARKSQKRGEGMVGYRLPQGKEGTWLG